MSAAGKTVVALYGVRKTYGETTALDGIDLTIYEGELLSLLGPSGCGKTTTLNVIAGFVVPDAGRVLIDGADVTDRPPWRRGLGVVFQSYALFPHMSVSDNVAFGLRERGVPRAEALARTAEALRLVRLPDAGDRRPAQLSGGQQQRVALARALVIQPRVLLLDEPLAALDRKLREEMRAELKDIQRAVGTTTVFVTHDQHEALGLSDRVAVVHRGRIEQLGTPEEIYERPATGFVADFVGASSVLPGRATGATTVEISGTTVRVRLRRTLTPGEPVRLLIRPEHVSVGGDAPNALPARVSAVMYLGDHSEIRLELTDGTRLQASVRGRAPVSVGDRVHARLSEDAVLEAG